MLNFVRFCVNDKAKVYCVVYYILRQKNLSLLWDDNGQGVGKRLGNTKGIQYSYIRQIKGYAFGQIV